MLHDAVSDLGLHYLLKLSVWIFRVHTIALDDKMLFFLSESIDILNPYEAAV